MSSLIQQGLYYYLMPCVLHLDPHKQLPHPTSEGIVQTSSGLPNEIGLWATEQDVAISGM